MVIVTGRGHCIAVALIFIPRFLFASCVVKFFSYASALFKTSNPALAVRKFRVKSEERVDVHWCCESRKKGGSGREERAEMERNGEMAHSEKKMVVGGRMERVENKLVFYVEDTFRCLKFIALILNTIAGTEKREPKPKKRHRINCNFDYSVPA